MYKFNLIPTDVQKSFVAAVAEGSDKVNSALFPQSSPSVPDSDQSKTTTELNYIPKIPKERLSREEKDRVLLVRMKKPDSEKNTQLYPGGFKTIAW